MKITDKDYNELKQVIMTDKKLNDELKRIYKKAGLSKERLAWDILHLSNYDTKALYSYLDDSNIQTALFKIIGEY